MVIHKGLVINLYRYSEALVIAQILLKDKNELIHKAVGWMLREVENRNREVEDRFLCKYKEDISRTMLRYAIDKFPEKTPDVFGVCVTNMKFKVKIR